MVDLFNLMPTFMCVFLSLIGCFLIVSLVSLWSMIVAFSCHSLI